jgi:prephenate dehydratase
MDVAATPARGRAVRPDRRPLPEPGEASDAPTIAFLGPAGTLAEALEAVCGARADLAFVPIENSIEGTVNATVDSLVFEVDLLIQREVVLDVHLHLAAAPGTELAAVRRVLSFPHAAAQCRRYLAEHFPGVDVVPTNSTAEAARLVGEDPRPDTAALAPRLAAELYGLDLLASSVEDHPDNQTRFVALARHGIPHPTGHDKTSIVCFQRADHPGSLHGILGQFAARNINLTKLESRPTKQGLGDYCFVIDLSGHVGDEVVADCLRDLHAGLAGVKFLGSYPAAGEHGPEQRRQADAAWQAADDWLRRLRGSIE